MNILFEDPDFNIFDLDNFELEDLIKDTSLLLNIARATMMDIYGVDWYNPEEDTFIHKDDMDTVHNIRYLHIIMSLPQLYPDVIDKIYARPIKRFQVLYRIYQDHIIEPYEVRLNDDVMGKLLGTFEIDISEKMKPKRLYNTVFMPDKEDEKFSHITGIFNRNREKVYLYCCLRLKNKEYNSYGDLLIPYTYMTEKQFMDYAKEHGYPVSSKSLRNYRNKSHQCVFPMPFSGKDPVTGIKKKYYDKSWVKYLKRIKELKDILKQDDGLYLRYDIKKLRELDKAMGGDSFRDIPYTD